MRFAVPDHERGGDWQSIRATRTGAACDRGTSPGCPRRSASNAPAIRGRACCARAHRRSCRGARRRRVQPSARTSRPCGPDCGACGRARATARRPSVAAAAPSRPCGSAPAGSRTCAGCAEARGTAPLARLRFANGRGQQRLGGLAGVGDDAAVVHERHRGGEPAEQRRAEQHQRQNADDLVAGARRQVPRPMPEDALDQTGPGRQVVDGRLGPAGDVVVPCLDAGTSVRTLSMDGCFATTAAGDAHPVATCGPNGRRQRKSRLSRDRRPEHVAHRREVGSPGAAGAAAPRSCRGCVMAEAGRAAARRFAAGPDRSPTGAGRKSPAAARGDSAVRCPSASTSTAATGSSRRRRSADSTPPHAHGRPGASTIEPPARSTTCTWRGAPGMP